MKLLALDSSGTVAAAAVIENDRLLASCYADAALTHSVKLMPMIDEMLQNLGLPVNEIDVFAAGTGPGSFTGLRIGIATVKGLAAAENKPVVGVCSLEATAYNFCAGSDPVYVITDARAGNVFAGEYLNEDGEMRELTAPQLVPLKKLMDRLFAPHIFAGDGAVKYKDILSESKFALIAPPHLLMPNAASLAYCAMRRVNEGKTLSPNELLPMYIQKSQAEQELERKKLERTKQS